MLLLLSLRLCCALAATTAPTATPAPPIASGCPFALRLTLLLLLGRTLLLLLLLFLLLLLALIAARALFAALAIAIPVASGALPARAAIVVPPLLPHLLLEFLDLAGHELARLRILLHAQFVMATIRAALPSFRIGFFARRADNTFG